MKKIKISKMKLGDFTIINMGQSPSSNFYNEDGKGLPFFQGVTDFGYKYPNETCWTTVAPKKAEINDILFSVRAPVGDVNIANKKCCIGRGIAAIRSKTNQIDYLYYLLKYQSINIQRLGTGAVYDAVKKSDLANILLDIFEDLNTQSKVGSSLLLYDDFIDTNRRRIQLLEKSARLLFREWFVYFRFPGYEKVKIVDGVPEGWGKKRLLDVADITMGQSPKSEYYNDNGVGLPFHQGVTGFGDRYPTNQTYCTQKNRMAQAGDILFSVRAPVGRINISTEKIIIGRGLSAIRSKENHQSYLFYELKNHFFKEDMIGGGAIFAAVTKKDLETVAITYPDEKKI